MRPNLSLVTLGVHDLPRAIRFYRDGLGLPLANDADAQGVAFFPLSGVVLALWDRTKLADDARVPAIGDGFRGIALALNTHDRAEVDAVLAEAARAGATITKPAGETFWGGYSGYFNDPEGHLWEVAHNPFWTLDDEGRVKGLGA